LLSKRLVGLLDRAAASDRSRLPAWYLALALAGTILLALLITLLPIQRAVRYRPGDALRYA
jgi:ABC-type lipoprotein release transport system permease subunit